MAAADSTSDQTIDRFLQELARGVPDRGIWDAPVVVAVSGGADSVALLTGLDRLRPPGIAAARIIVAHGRHDLRAEAGADARFVAHLAAKLGATAAIRDLPVLERDGVRGEGIEARARRARRGFFRELALEHGARAVLLAHTADDQAETVLHRALRGTGLGGLGGMAPAARLCDGIAILRPLLRVPRAVVREAVVALGQGWCEDATNADTRFARNFLRHDILPRCEAGPYPAASAALVRLAGHAAAAARAVASAAERMVEMHGSRHAGGRIVIQTRRLAGLDERLVAEIFVTLWRREEWPQRDMAARHYEALATMALAAAETGRRRPFTLELPGGVRARAADGEMELSRTGHEKAGDEAGTAATARDSEKPGSAPRP
jgi:tRNA(Ile)-lysidine synthase